MRLIDKDAIPWDVEGVGEIPVITKEEIDEMPTVELIRCKDCKYWKYYDSVKANVCKRRYNGHWWESHEDDYCSRAERKEE